MPTTATTPTLRTAEEAAEILRVRRSWLERQAAARKIWRPGPSAGYQTRRIAAT